MWLGSKFTSLSDSLFKSLFRVLFRYDIFISYARRDGKEYALKLRDQLKQLDFTCFLDYDELPPGNSLNNTLKRALRKSATLIIVGTERAVKSRYVELEVSEFARTSRAIIPIDIEGTLAEVPWRIIKERDIVWIDEVKAALAKGVPSPNVADSIDKLFKYTRRNSRVRAQVFTSILLFVVVVAASIFMIRQQVKAATTASAEAERQKIEAKNQKAVADSASADAAEQRKAADVAINNAAIAKGKAEASKKQAAIAEKAADDATLEAKRQEKMALANAERAKAEQTIAEERTRYVRAQQMGVQADLNIDTGDDLERSALLSVESLKRAFTPEGYIAWARTMQLIPRKVETKLARGDDNVSAIAFSPDGRWFAQAGSISVTLYRTDNSAPPIKLTPQSNLGVKSIAFVHDGDWVAVAGQQAIEVWDLKTCAKTCRVIKSLGEFTSDCIAFSPDGRYVAISGAIADKAPTVQVLDTTKNWSVVARLGFDDPGEYAMSVAFSPDGRWLAGGFRGGKLAIWDVAGFEKGGDATLQPAALVATESSIYTIAFSPKGHYLASGNTQSTVHIWDVSAGSDGKTVTLSKLPGEQKIGNRFPDGEALVFSPNESYIVTSQRSRAGTDKPLNTAYVWEVSTGRVAGRILLGNGYGFAASFSPRDDLLAISDGKVSFFKSQFGGEAVRLNYDGEAHAVDISPGGRWLVASGTGGARVFQTADWSRVTTLAEADDISGTVVSPDGRWLAARSKDKVAVFDTTHWKRLNEVNEKASSIGFSPDSRWLVTVSGTLVKLFQVEPWQETPAMKHIDMVGGVSFSADGRWLATRTSQRPRRHYTELPERDELFVWDIASGRPVACVTEKGAPTNGTMRSKDTAGGAVCSEVKEAGRQALLSEARNWKDSIKSTETSLTSNDGRWYAERNNDGGLTLNFKEGNTDRQVALFMPGRGVFDMAFTPDSRWLATTEDNMVMLWPLKPSDMIDEACARLRRRDLTSHERDLYISDGTLQPTCSLRLGR